MNGIEKVKLVVQDQFPEFYREEYPQFVEFIKQYYAFLETTKVGRVEYFKDIDDSIDSFILQLKNDFARNIPQFGNLSDRDFLLFAKEFYAARGSEDSYRFLFRAMFGKEVELFYPETIVLKASDGRWEQDVAIRVDTVSDITSWGGTTISISDSLGRISKVTCTKVKLLSGTTWEVYIDRLYTGITTVGSTVSNLGFSGTIVTGANNVSVVNGGSGFTVGNYFNVIVAGQKLIFRVSKVSNGSIIKAEIIQAAANFHNTVHVLVSPGSNNSTNSSSTMTPVGNQAYLKINPGSNIKYPGFYSSANGFLSDVMRLQDNDFYQAYSYVIRLDEQLSAYKNVVKRLLHPSGMALWGEYNVTSEFTLNIDIASVLQDLIAIVQDDVIWSDTTTFYSVKGIVDTVVSTDAMSFMGTKVLSDTVIMLDTGTASVQKSQDYAAADYFSQTGTSQYVMGSSSQIGTW